MERADALVRCVRETGGKLSTGDEAALAEDPELLEWRGGRGDP